MNRNIKTLVARVEAFAASLGESERMTLAKSQPLYDAFTQCSDEDKEIVKAKFVRMFFIKASGLREAEAEMMLAADRPTRDEAGVQSSYRAATGKFDYHFIDRGPKAGPSGDRQPGDLQAALKAIPRGATKHMTAMADDYFGGDFGAMITALKALKAVADAKAKKAKVAA